MTSFETLKNNDGSVSIRNINVQILAKDMFQISNNILSFIIKNVFVPNAENSYNIKCIIHFQSQRFVVLCLKNFKIFFFK